MMAIESLVCLLGTDKETVAHIKLEAYVLHSFILSVVIEL